MNMRHEEPLASVSQQQDDVGKSSCIPLFPKDTAGAFHGRRFIITRGRRIKITDHLRLGAHVQLVTSYRPKIDHLVFVLIE